MANLTRTASKRAVNAVLGCGQSDGANQSAAGVFPWGDYLGTWNSGSVASGVGTTTTTATALSPANTITLTGTMPKRIPDDSVIMVVSAAGGVDTAQAFTVNGAVASGASTIVVDNTTITRARANGDLVFLVGYLPYLALFDNSVTPTESVLGTELSMTGYARQAIQWTAPTNAAPPVAWNAAIMTFGPLTGATGAVTVRYLGVMDDPTKATGTVTACSAFWDVGAGNVRVPNANDSISVGISGSIPQLSLSIS